MGAPPGWKSARRVNAWNGTCTFRQPAKVSVNRDSKSSACSASVPPSLISNWMDCPEPVPFTQKEKPSKSVQSRAVARLWVNPPQPLMSYCTRSALFVAVPLGRSAAPSVVNIGLSSASLPKVMTPDGTPDSKSSTVSVRPSKGSGSLSSTATVTRDRGDTNVSAGVGSDRMTSKASADS